MNSVCEKVWFMINGPSEMLFFNYCFFPLYKFQMTIVSNLIMDLEGYDEVFYNVINVFNLHIFEKGTAAIYSFSGICTEIRFVSLFLLNERNITTSLLVTHLKCTIVRYANLNLSSINKSFFN